MAFEVRSYKPSDFHSLNDLLWRSFPYHFRNDPPDYFRDFVKADPFHRDCDLKVICDTKGDVISTAKVFRRWVWYKGASRLMGGIGNVATAETHRGKGLSKLLLEECCKVMTSAGCEFASLYAGPIPLYEKFGFRKTRLYSWTFSDFIPGPRRKIPEIGKVDWKKDLTSIMQLHSEQVATSDFGVERNPLYWERYILSFKGRNSDTWKYCEGTKLKGYLSLSFDSKEDFCELRDSYLPDQEMARLLIQHALMERKTHSLKIRMAGESTNIVRALEGISGKIDQSVYEGFMVKEIGTNLPSGMEPDYRKVILALVDGF
jgi:predicted N-acetyltransferase YhbS